MQTPDQQTWQQKAEAKQDKTNSQIPEEWRLNKNDIAAAEKQRKLSGTFIESFLDGRELEITSNDTIPLLIKIRLGQYTSVEAIKAFCKRAAIAHQINDCLHEIVFDQALKRAQELDDYFIKHNVTIDPLHGLRVSFKDQFHVKGVDTTIRYFGWIDTYEGDTNPTKVHKIESQIVADLLSLGAVIHCKTSLQQTLLLGETVNNIIGRTLNPVNQLLSCGGSSGGEGALNALRGSTFGVGTDIGGSVRIPAAFCGIYSMKPTHNRFPYRDVANTNPRQNTYALSVGFLSTSIDALGLAMSSVLSTQQWLRDPEVVPIPWREDVVISTLDRVSKDGSNNHSRSIKFSIYWTDGVVNPHLPIVRGLHTVVDALRKAGHKVVDWNPPSQSTAKRIHVAFLKADGAHDILKQLDLSGEPLIPELRRSFQLHEPTSLLKYQTLTLEGRDYSAAYSDYWKSTADDEDVRWYLQVAGQMIDAVIMPVAAHAAIIPGKYYHTAFTEVINLLDYTAAVIPITKSDKILDGDPVGVQLVGRNTARKRYGRLPRLSLPH